MEIDIEKVDASGDDLDLTQLMDQIRRDAEKRKREAFKNGAPSFQKPLATEGFNGLLSQRNSSLAELKLQPPLEKREQYQMSDLLGFHDEAFVRNAYKVILKREPDDAGFAVYLKNLRSGRYNKIDILRSLRFSPEGRKANVSIKGLGKLSYLRKLYSVPVLGYLLRLAVAIVRLPVLIMNHRRLEAHTAAQFERVANHLNDAVAQLSEADRRQAENSRRHFDAVQQQLRLQMDSLVNEQGKLAQSYDALKQSQNTLQNDLNTRLIEAHELTRQQLEERYTAELQALKAQVEKQIDDVLERLQSSRMNIAQQEMRLSLLIDSVHEPTPQAGQRDRLERLKAEEDHLLDSLYFSLEDVLRGTPEQIKEEVKVYLPVLESAGISSGILDVGCGRGEWLQVLEEAGLEAKGIDQNRILVQQCKELSLDVIESEALNYLRSLADGSLNAVTAFHFAEHLPLKTLVKFLDEVGRTLRPGGLMILETPNPENLLVGSCNFYLDPTHKHPIPIPTMQLLVEARGFVCQEVMRLHPVADAKIEVKDQLTSHLNHFLYGPMNYAVVARKPQLDT